MRSIKCNMYIFCNKYSFLVYICVYICAALSIKFNNNVSQYEIVSKIVLYMMPLIIMGIWKSTEIFFMSLSFGMTRKEYWINSFIFEFLICAILALAQITLILLEKCDMESRYIYILGLKYDELIGSNIIKAAIFYLTFFLVFYSIKSLFSSLYCKKGKDYADFSVVLALLIYFVMLIFTNSLNDLCFANVISIAINRSISYILIKHTEVDLNGEKT